LSIRGKFNLAFSVAVIFILWFLLLIYRNACHQKLTTLAEVIHDKNISAAAIVIASFMKPAAGMTEPCLTGCVVKTNENN